jgi:hypothetical protein
MTKHQPVARQAILIGPNFDSARPCQLGSLIAPPVVFTFELAQPCLRQEIPEI